MASSLSVCTLSGCSRVSGRSRGLCLKHREESKQRKLDSNIDNGATMCAQVSCRSAADSSGRCLYHDRLFRGHKYRLNNPVKIIALREKTSCRLSNLRSSSKKRGHTCDLTEDEYASLIELPCHYCGGTLARTGSGLDQRKAGYGYSTVNAVPCCPWCNNVKSDAISDGEMSEIVNLLKTLRGCDDIWWWHRKNNPNGSSKKGISKYTNDLMPDLTTEKDHQALLPNDTQLSFL